MCDNAELQQVENDNSAAFQSKHTSQESYKNTKCILIQENSEEKQTEHIFNCKYDVSDSD